MTREGWYVKIEGRAAIDSIFINSLQDTHTITSFLFLPQRLLSLPAVDNSWFAFLHCISLCLGRSHQLQLF